MLPTRCVVVVDSLPGLHSGRSTWRNANPLTNGIICRLSIQSTSDGSCAAPLALVSTGLIHRHALEADHRGLRSYHLLFCNVEVYHDALLGAVGREELW